MRTLASAFAIAALTFGAAATSGVAEAGPKVLTAAQMDQLTAGTSSSRPSGISQSNHNSTNQYSKATSVAVGKCVFCLGFLNGGASGLAVSFNLNGTEQKNELGGHRRP